MDDVVNAVGDAANAAGDAIGDAANAVGDAVSDAAGAVGSAIEGIEGAVWDAASKVIMGSIQKAIEFLNSKSPGPKLSLKMSGCKSLKPCVITGEVKEVYKKDIRFNLMKKRVSSKLGATMHTISQTKKIDLIKDQPGLLTFTSTNVITFDAKTVFDVGNMKFSMPLVASISSKSVLNFNKA